MRKTLMFGFLGGILCAITGFAWLFSAVDKVPFERDATPSLGMQFVDAPQVALRPRTPEELASFLKISSTDQLNKEASLLAERISSGFLPSDWAEQCPTQNSAALCRVVGEYFNRQAEIFPSPARSSDRSKIIFDVRKVQRLETEDFNRLLTRIPDWGLSQFQPFVTAALESESCPKNFSIALAHKLEIHLGSSDPRVRQWMNSLLSNGLKCLESSNSAAEFILIRAGLIYMAQDQDLLALEQFTRALTIDPKKEEYRSLYWSIQLLNKLNRDPEALPLKLSLYKYFPISWYSILAKSQEGIDPLDYFLKAPAYMDSYESGNDFIDFHLAWLERVLELENTTFAIKRYGEFLIRSLPSDAKAGTYQYLARMFDRRGYHRLQILTLGILSSSRPQDLSRESLRLMYPKPFFDDLNSKSAHLDTAVLLGLARQESGFDPGATSSADARGLLQILPSTARGIRRRNFQPDQLYDHTHNIEIGSRYLLQLVNMFDGSVEKALASYNAGQGNVRKWEIRYGFSESIDPLIFLDLIPFRETRDYVPSILRNAFWYHRLFPELQSQLNENVVTSHSLSDLLKNLKAKSSQ